MILTYWLVITSLAVNTMTITVGNTYTELTIEAGQEELIFPENFNGMIRPGDIPPSVKHIRFDEEFNQELKPGVINETVEKLVLREGYRHHLLPGAIPEATNLYIYDRNREFVPADRSFFLYEYITAGNIYASESERSVWDFELSSRELLEAEPEQEPRELVGKWLWVSGRITPKTKVIDTAVETKIIDTAVETKIDTPAETTDVASPSTRDLDLKIDNLSNDILTFSKTMLQTVRLLSARISALEAQA